MFNEKDLAMLESRGVTPAQVEAQLERFKTGFPYLRVQAAASVGNGIMQPTMRDEHHYIKLWNKFLQSGGVVEKMVPASGAASRMFKDLFAFADRADGVPTKQSELDFFAGLRNFAFYPLLAKACVRLHGLNPAELVEAGRHVDVVKTLLGAEGLNYGALPKGLLKFHKSPGGVHTPVEEHLEEGAQYAAGADRVARLHFTVSHEHRELFERLLAEKLAHIEAVCGVSLQVTLSEQKPATDTIAANTDGTPCRDAQGNLFFRPAGHGALIENLNDRDADVIFLKNIDNVVPQSLRSTTTRYKKVIGGLLIDVQRHVARMVGELEQGVPARKRLDEMLHYLEHTLCTRCEATATMDDTALAQYLLGKFNRPLRVCGMVRNEGEPGGGPYLAYNADGSCSPQILEAAQIDHNNPEAMALMAGGTHFNPVDLVCYIRDTHGKKFDLRKYVDPETGLISEKSLAGVPIRALELPGLWNGSMSDWNTLFVEVPAETFNPVKTVNDLLRPAHLG